MLQLRHASSGRVWESTALQDILVHGARGLYQVMGHEQHPGFGCCLVLDTSQRKKLQTSKCYSLARSALQSLHKACEVARSNNYYPGSLFLTWVSYYESHINSDQSSVNEWNAMQDVQSHRPDSPALFTDV